MRTSNSQQNTSCHKQRHQFLLQHFLCRHIHYPSPQITPQTRRSIYRRPPHIPGAVTLPPSSYSSTPHTPSWRGKWHVYLYLSTRPAHLLMWMLILITFICAKRSRLVQVVYREVKKNKSMHGSERRHPRHPRFFFSALNKNLKVTIVVKSTTAI
jgi:hypothetical protein